VIRILHIFVILVIGALAPATQAAAEPLPSWRDGPAKEAILGFVRTATAKGKPDYLAPEERIAVFDNDGTLWAEKPVYVQVFFALDQAKELARRDPKFASTPALKAAAAGDFKALAATGREGLAEVVAATHSGMTVEDFEAAVRTWIGKARNTEKNMRFTEMVYQPMLELLDYLRANDFKTYIVSGGGVDFMRAFTKELYGVPPELVIGSMGEARFEIVDGKPQIMKDSGILFINDGPGKPLAIVRQIGRRPVFVAGNSDGDLQMLQWGTAGAAPRLGIIIHHTDAAREWAYDRDSPVGRLDKALDLSAEDGWMVVDMAKDWKQIFPNAE